MRRWLFLLFLADLAATPFLIGAFAGGGSTDPTDGTSPRAASTTSLPVLDPCDLLNGSNTEFQGIVDHYGDIELAADELGIETGRAGC